MDDTAAFEIIRSVLGGIAPEVDLDTVDPTAMLQDEVDLDSINFLDFVAGLHDRTGIDIPERDYPEIATLDGCRRYLIAHAAVGA